MEFQRKANPDCVNASNPFHVCADYCTQRSTGAHKPRNPPPKLAENGVERRKFDPGQDWAESSGCGTAQNGEIRSVEEPKMEPRQYRGESSSSGESSRYMVDRRKVDPSCVNASNPFHVCAEYCSQKKLEMGGKSGSRTPRGSKRFLGSITARESKGGLKVTERKDVHPNCVNASNPFHKCSDYCFQRMNEVI